MHRFATFSGLAFVFLGSFAEIASAGGAPCSAGAYGPNGLEPCTPCEAGTFAPNPGATECEPCPIGTFAEWTGSASCVPCTPGSFAAQPGASTCDPCAPGTFVDYAGAPACLDCGPGFYTDQPGQTSCLLCGAGTFAAQARSSACEPCPAGHYNESLGAAACTACSPGTFSAEVGAMSSATCTPCPAGRFAAGAGAASCLTCPRNSYAPTTGSTACIACGCDDGVACTRDSCNAVSGVCTAPVVPGCQPREVAFAGNVTYVDPLLASTALPGDPVEGRFRYDPEAPDETPLEATFGDYPSGVTSFEVTIGSGSAVTASSPAGRVTVVNDGIGGDVVQFEALDSDGLVSSPIETPAGGTASIFWLRLSDSGAAAIASDALPAGRLDFGRFPIRSASLGVTSPTLGTLYVVADDVVDAPEPGGLLAAACALASLRALRGHAAREGAAIRVRRSAAR